MALPAQPSGLIRFGVFELDAMNGQLRKAGVSLKMHPQPLRVLLLLAEHAGQAVTREEIQQCLWGDNTFVDFERGINFCINQIRTTLGDDAEKPRYVETLPRRGYRFIFPITLPKETKSGPDSPTVATGLKPAEKSTRLRWVAATSSIVIVGLAVGGWWFFSSKPHALTEKDTIVLADFTNTTGDTVFDGTLRQGLVVQLEQSPFLSLISDERTRQTLRLMGQPADAKLTPEIGHQICQRTQSAVVLSGSIASLGNQYVLGLKAVNCRTGDSLAEEQETADGKEQVLRALSQAATKLRGRLGESLKSNEKLDTPLEQATTPSLEALQAYSLGRRAFVGGDRVAAIPALQRAVQLDPNFAQAYSLLGMSFGRIGENQLGGESLQKAYELRDRVSERERFYIDVSHSNYVTGDLEKARQICELWKQTYPRDFVAVAFLGSVLNDLGQYEKALVELREALRLDPGAPIRYDGVVITYVLLGRFKEARATAEEALAKKLDSPELHQQLYNLAFLESDAAGMAHELTWSAGKAVYEDAFLNLEAGTSSYYGKMKKAREFTDRAISLADRTQRKETAANYEVWQALTEALFGNRVEARKRATDALKLSSFRGVKAMVGVTAALLGETDRAQALAGDDVIINAELALNRNHPQKAIEILQAAKPYDLASSFVRGNAYLAAHRAGEAGTEFQRILDHPGVVLYAPWAALARLGLARAHAMQGDTAKAKAAYQDFLTLWKDADPDIPILIAAKAEYAKLH